MGEHPNDGVLAASALTRLWVAAERLGIDPAPLQRRAPEVVPALAAGGWASLDSDDRLALRCTQTDTGPGEPIARPAYARRYELELDHGHVAEIVAAHGRRAYTEDREVLLGAGIADEVTRQVGDVLDLLGDGSCDGLARRRAPANDTTGAAGTVETWGAWVAYDPATGPDAEEIRDLTRQRLVRLATAIKVHPAQVKILEQLHQLSHHGFSAGFELDARALHPVLIVEYQRVPWDAVVQVAERLRPVPAQAPRLGALAGAFDAQRAASLQLAYIPNDVARVRVSVDAT